MNLIYGVKDRPQTGKLIALSFQQLLAIIATTIAVPAIVGNGMTASSALFGAGAGTMVYLILTKFSSPVFLGSSFAFIGSMFAAFAGGVSMYLGFAGLILGALVASFVYVVIAIIVKFVGVNWIERLMPAVVIGPTVAIIGLSLAGNAIGDLLTGDCASSSKYVALVCGLFTLFAICNCSVFGRKTRSIPFIVGISFGYLLALIFTVIGKSIGKPELCIIDFTPFNSLFSNGMFHIVNAPDFAFAKAFKGISKLNAVYVGTIFVAYAPVAFVTFAEHIADHKNLSTIINQNLIKSPGLHRTLLGDGLGSLVGGFFGGCTNTTYGESVACVAITGNASVITIVFTSVIAMVVSFISPIVAVLDSIPSCVMGGTCMTLYGFISVSGLKMIKNVDLDDNRNLFTCSVILIAGIGGLTLNFGSVTITEVACALILGVLINLFVNIKRKDK